MKMNKLGIVLGFVIGIGAGEMTYKFAGIDGYVCFLCGWITGLLTYIIFLKSMEEVV